MSAIASGEQTLRSLSSPYVRQHLLTALGTRILSGHYAAGSLLPTEAQLCVEFGVSRTAMRESIKMLSAKGLLVSRQRTGTRVQEASSWHRLDPDILEWTRGLTFDPDFARSLIEARLAIEPAAAGLAAVRASSLDLAGIEKAYDLMRATPVTELEACARADVEFHSAVMRASHNPVFAALVVLIEQALLSAFELTTSISDSYELALSVHGEVLEAIRLRQPEEARRRMRQLIEIASSDLLRHKG